MEDWQINEILLDARMQSGSGLFSYLKRKHINKLKSRPNNINDFMNEKGDMKIVEMSVYRTPINKNIKFIMNLLSKNKLKEVQKKYKYDNIFHLYAVITLENGEKYELQKNEIVEIKPFRNKYQPNSVGKLAYIPEPVTFNEIMLKLEEKYHNSLYLYQAYNYNCQDFLNKFTKEAGVTHLSDFIMQYFNEAFKAKKVRKITRFLTDLSASFKRYVLGKGEDDSEEFEWLK